MTRRAVTSEDHDSLRAAARRLLEENRIDGRNSTLPAKGQYPHQWNWDSAFIAIGLAGVDPYRALDELESLFKGQWGNGMVPHIVYSSEDGGRGTYFPQSWRWGTEDLSRTVGPPPGVKTSGITQPPVAAIAAEHIAEARLDERVLAGLHRLYPKLLASHRFLLRERDPDGTGLAFQVHPWETGMDNSPRWQRAIKAVPIDRSALPSYERLDTSLVPAAERPTGGDYDCYAFLIEVYKKNRYSSRALRERCPFLVQDVLFNAVLHRANEALITIGTMIGRPTDEIDEIKGWRKKTCLAFERLWDDDTGRYLDADLISGNPIDENTIATFVPLYAKLPNDDQARRLVKEHLRNPQEYWPAEDDPHFVVTTVAKNSSSWDGSRYWNGPIWVNTNWMVLQGLQRYDDFFTEEANRVRDDTLSLLSCALPGGSDWWFWEYFNPLTGNVHGIDGFSWSAALALELTDPGRCDRHQAP
jgi:hypothetical protein